MDSQQLIHSLHEAQRQAGRQPVAVALIWDDEAPEGSIEVSYNAGPSIKTPGGELTLKPRSEIRHNHL